MDIDIILEPDLDPKQINELGIKAEEYGINAIWTSNYFAHWDPFLSLVPLAQTTKKIKYLNNLQVDSNIFQGCFHYQKW